MLIAPEFKNLTNIMPRVKPSWGTLSHADLIFMRSACDQSSLLFLPVFVVIYHLVMVVIVMVV